MSGEDCVREFESYRAEPNPSSSSGLDLEEPMITINSSDDKDDDDYGPIFKSWVARLSTSEDFVRSRTNFTIAKF